MRLQSKRHKIFALSVAGCLSLLFGIQAFAESVIQQPSTVAGVAAVSHEVSMEQDEAVSPAGCTGSCCDGDCCGNKGCCSKGNCCCEAVCCPKCVTEEVKKHCWKVKPELVCIPGFRFSWSCLENRCKKGCCDDCCGDDCCSTGKCCDCAPPRCGRVRCINVLEKHEYTCEECGCEWEVKCVRTNKGRCSSGCRCPSCGHKNDCCAECEKPNREKVQLASTDDNSSKR